MGLKNTKVHLTGAPHRTFAHLPARREVHERSRRATWWRRSQGRDGEEMAMWDGKPWFFRIWFGYGSIPINTIFNGMNIHLPAILMFTRGTRFWHTAIWVMFLWVFVETCGNPNTHFSCPGPGACAWNSAPERQNCNAGKRKWVCPDIFKWVTPIP